MNSIYNFTIFFFPEKHYKSHDDRFALMHLIKSCIQRPKLHRISWIFESYKWKKLYIIRGNYALSIG